MIWLIFLMFYWYKIFFVRIRYIFEFLGGIELRQPLLASKRSDEVVSSHSSTNLATGNKQKENVKLEISNTLETGKLSQENNDTQLPKKYQKYNITPEDASSKKDITSDNDTNHHNVQKNSILSDTSAKKQLPLGLELKKIIFHIGL